MRRAYGSRPMSSTALTISCHLPTRPKRRTCVINLSYGPTTGPHDGTAQLEAALTASCHGVQRHPWQAQA